MKILVISLAGIGDTLFATPLLHELRLNFPEATIDVLARWVGSRQILEGNPHINTVYQEDLVQMSTGQRLRFLGPLRKNRYDVSINVHPQSRREYRLVARCAGTRKRLSHVYECSGWLDKFLVNRTVLQDYTTDKALLIKALEDYTPHLPTGVGAAESGGPFRADNNRQLPAVQRSNPQLQQLQRMNRLDATLETLRLIATHMTGATHRNSIIWITSGYPPVNEENAQMQAALAAINDANIAIYPIDARGLSASANAYINIQTMQAFAEETGGQAYFNRNDIDHEIQEAISDPQSTYLLGFYLSDHDLDGKFHKLKVTVDRPGLTLHYRAGYTASADPNLRRAAAEPIDTQMLSFLDSAAIGIQAQVARENDASRKSLKVSLSLDRNTLGLKAGQQQVNLVEMFAEIDNQGQIVARITQSVRFDMPAPNRDPGYDQTIREQEGATRLRVFVQDKATGRTGSLTIPLADISAN